MHCLASKCPDLNKISNLSKFKTESQSLSTLMRKSYRPSMINVNPTSRQAIPYSFPLSLHAYREIGNPSQHTKSLLHYFYTTEMATCHTWHFTPTYNIVIEYNKHWQYKLGRMLRKKSTKCFIKYDSQFTVFYVSD